MQRLDLKLLAISTMDVDRTTEVYSCIGVRFAQERKEPRNRLRVAGLSPQRLVMEIHAVDCPEQVDRNTRLGFAVPDFQAALRALAAWKAEFVKEPRSYPHGHHAVVKDPDGRLVDLYPRRTSIGIGRSLITPSLQNH